MAALATQLEVFGKVSVLAQRPVRRSLSTVPDDYRALVCIFLNGGNDANNMLVPNHNDANVSNYSAYAAARSAARFGSIAGVPAARSLFRGSAA